MEDIAEEIDREDEIITDLLSLVKMDRTDMFRLHTVGDGDRIAAVALLRLIERFRDLLKGPDQNLGGQHRDGRGDRPGG